MFERSVGVTMNEIRNSFSTGGIFWIPPPLSAGVSVYINSTDVNRNQVSVAVAI